MLPAEVSVRGTILEASSAGGVNCLRLFSSGTVNVVNLDGTIQFFRSLSAAAGRYKRNTYPFRRPRACPRCRVASHQSEECRLLRWRLALSPIALRVPLHHPRPAPDHEPGGGLLLDRSRERGAGVFE
jgi:hypothetical protein